eukprot:scaffold18864_cov68-Phaeocystis_antarctica.AAC.7
MTSTYVHVMCMRMCTCQHRTRPASSFSPTSLRQNISANMPLRSARAAAPPSPSARARASAAAELAKHLTYEDRAERKATEEGASQH